LCWVSRAVPHPVVAIHLDLEVVAAVGLCVERVQRHAAAIVGPAHRYDFRVLDCNSLSAKVLHRHRESEHAVARPGMDAHPICAKGLLVTMSLGGLIVP